MEEMRVGARGGEKFEGREVRVGGCVKLGTGGKEER